MIATTDLRDCHGLTIKQAMDRLPKDIQMWPKSKPVKNPNLLREIHEEWKLCFVCERRKNWLNLYFAFELHHLARGSRGRSDERCNLIMVCRNCHERICSVPLIEVLAAKHKHDPDGCDWKRLAILIRHRIVDDRQRHAKGKA